MIAGGLRYAVVAMDGAAAVVGSEVGSSRLLEKTGATPHVGGVICPENFCGTQVKELKLQYGREGYQSHFGEKKRYLYRDLFLHLQCRQCSNAVLLQKINATVPKGTIVTADITASRQTYISCVSL